MQEPAHPHPPDGDPSTSQTQLKERGNYWEATYKLLDITRPAWVLSAEADTGGLAHNTGKRNLLITTGKAPKRALNLKDSKFDSCDINHFTLSDSSFYKCFFIDCRLIKATFTNVKFSSCTFSTVHFLNVTFQGCQFINCTFANITIAAEQTKFEATAISAASILRALTTNTNRLPTDVTADYQHHRLVDARVKIARALYLSVRHQPDIDLEFEANQGVETSQQQRRIAHLRHRRDDAKLTKRGFLHRHIAANALRASHLAFRVAGFATGWGRAPLRSGWMLVATAILFSFVYWGRSDHLIQNAILRSLDCTFVFGYTKYATPEDMWLSAIMFSNALMGFAWYALLVPVISRRLFR